jgi:hypothetical protein
MLYIFCFCFQVDETRSNMLRNVGTVMEMAAARRPDVHMQMKRRLPFGRGGPMLPPVTF